MGSGNHLSGALFAEAAGIAVTHVPYKGTGPALADVLSGIITMNFSSLPPAVPQVKRGNLKALAVTGMRRLSSLPDVPTLKEQGIDAVINGWHGLFAPAGTPDALLDTIASKARQAMTAPKWAEVLDKDGVELPPERTRVEFARYIADEHAFWGKKLKALKVDME
ncbi:MAG: tripartite tricarboxylate transporter substrate binding protein [Reyranella sp.]|nr:tripartite tricarboxylate transporter substrate binding protein [Reyranella sp.]